MGKIKVKIKLKEQVFYSTLHARYYTEKIYRKPAIEAGVIIRIKYKYWARIKGRWQKRTGRIEWGHKKPNKPKWVSSE